jgi:hypothetical protein
MSGLKRVAMLFNPDTAPGGGTYYFRVKLPRTTKILSDARRRGGGVAARRARAATLATITGSQQSAPGWVSTFADRPG